MGGLASKSTTTWFLAGRDLTAQFIKFHFEIVNTIQLAYISAGLYNSALTWLINTAYITSTPGNTIIFQTFIDTLATEIE
jgi:hypothetical protein